MELNSKIIETTAVKYYARNKAILSQAKQAHGSQEKKAAVAQYLNQQVWTFIYVPAEGYGMKWGIIPLPHINNNFIVYSWHKNGL